MLELDLGLLSRIQFAFTVGFHILFPSLTIALSFFLVIFESLWLKTGQPLYVRLYKLWAKVFALSFGMGVVSGIVLAFQIGTNFSEFALFSGPVMGPLMSVEVLTAFFIEAGFIGVMLFGWNKVGPRLHFLATILVAIGTLNSAFWILSANSWMQTPGGFSIVEGQMIVEDWIAVIFNASFPYRFIHMILASFLTCAFVVAAASAWYLLKNRHIETSKKALSLSMWVALVCAPLQIFVGDLHGLNTFEHQPIKVAAMEGLWETQRGAPLLLAAWPDEEQEANSWEIAIPGLASLILTHDWDGEVQGLRSVPAEDRPPVAVVFWSFRVMVGIGLLMLFTALVGLFLRRKDRLYHKKWFLRLCVLMVPSGFVAVITGWLVAEIGRQPYTIYGYLRTEESLSPVIPESVAVTLSAFFVVYAILLGFYIYYFLRLIQKGPIETEELPPHPKAMRGVRIDTVVPEN